MNERIKALAQESFFDEATNAPSDKMYTFSEAKMEHFAELIIHECVEQIKLKGTDWIDFAPSQMGIRPEYVDMAKHIKQHFGVE